MRSGIKVVLLLVTCHLNVVSWCQPRCATTTLRHNAHQHIHVNSEHREENNESLVIVPVVVHVIHNDLSQFPNQTRSSNVSDQQIYSQIRVLNEDFRKKEGSNGFNTSPLGSDVGIEFCLASIDPNGNPTNGINRIYHSKLSWNISPDDERQMKSLSFWPSDKYLNIWVANLNTEQGFGYARYPDEDSTIDGIAVHYRAFGTMGAARYPYNLGRTTTHEVGHWFNLVHIWGDADCGDDFVDDTPIDKQPNQDNDCIDSSECTGAIKRSDLTNNYMDYSPDRCMNLFTMGQKARMRSALLNPRRKKLLESTGCGRSHSLQFSINVFPSPASEKLYVDIFGAGLQNATIEWFNMTGKKISDSEIKSNEYQKRFEIDVSNWPRGMYVIKISNNVGKKYLKVLIYD